MLKNKIHLDYHLICGPAELEDFLRYQLIKPWQSKNSRHDLFLKIKHPQTAFYQGGWGQELLLVTTDPNTFYGPQASVHCTQRRAQEIRQWIVDNLHEQLTQ
jgi:hypothetical protein